MALTKQDDIRVANYNLNDGCDEGTKVSFPWDSGGICWNNNPFCWDDVSIAKEVLEEVQRVGGGFIPAIEKLDDRKKKRFIELITQIKGETGIYKDKKEVKDVDLKLTEADVKRAIEEILNIQITVEEINGIQISSKQ